MKPLPQEVDAMELTGDSGRKEVAGQVKEGVGRVGSYRIVHSIS